MTTVESHIYWRRERTRRYALECKHDPMKRGEISRLADMLVDHYLSQTDQKKMSCDDLTDVSLDSMSDEENYWYVTHHDKGSEKIKRSLNARPRYNKYMKASRV